MEKYHDTRIKSHHFLPHGSYTVGFHQEITFSVTHTANRMMISRSCYFMKRILLFQEDQCPHDINEILLMVLYCVSRPCFLKKHALSSKTQYILTSALPPQINPLLSEHLASSTVLKMSHCISTCTLAAPSTIPGDHTLSTTPSSSNSHFRRCGHSETNSSPCHRMYSTICSFQLSFQPHETGVRCSLASAPTR